VNNSLTQLARLVSNVPVLRATPSVTTRQGGVYADPVTYNVVVGLLDQPGLTYGGINSGNLILGGVQAATVTIADTTTPTPTVSTLGRLLTISGAVSDGETVTVTAGGNTDIYEFNSTGGVTAGRIAVNVPTSPTTFECLEALLSAMTVRTGNGGRAVFQAAILSPTTLLVYGDTVAPAVSETMTNGAFTSVVPLVDGAGIATVTLPAGTYVAAETVTVTVSNGVLADGRAIPGSRSTLTFT
jgi:hypothetical protein